MDQFDLDEIDQEAGKTISELLAAVDRHDTLQGAASADMLAQRWGRANLKTATQGF